MPQVDIKSLNSTAALVEIEYLRGIPFLLFSGVLRNNTIFDRLVFKKIREGLGGHVKLIICGSAPLAENVMRFARSAMGCVVLEGYGE